jgi:glycosyltransferase involved in cell wall biosynthesis
MTRTIGIAIPTFERPEWTLRAFEQVLYDDRVKTITIVDDFSKPELYNELDGATMGMDKVRLYRNGQNVDCYRNKKNAIELSDQDWNILADSDNIFSPSYLDRIFEIEQWEPDTIYAPAFAAPHFDYRSFSELTLTKENVSQYMNWPMCSTLLNTANYFVNRSEYLQVWKGDIDPITADSMYMAFCWLESGREIKVVQNLVYDHSVHPMSHYKQNAHRSGHLHMQIEQQLRNLR